MWFEKSKACVAGGFVKLSYSVQCRFLWGLLSGSRSPLTFPPQCCQLLPVHRRACHDTRESRTTHRVRTGQQPVSTVYFFKIVTTHIRLNLRSASYFRSNMVIILLNNYLWGVLIKVLTKWKRRYLITNYKTKQLNAEDTSTICCRTPESGWK